MTSRVLLITAISSSSRFFILIRLFPKADGGVDRFCWGGAPNSAGVGTKRSQSASSIDQYFNGASLSDTRPGISTPRALQKHELVRGTPSSTSSYYTSYSSTSTPTTMADVEDVEDGLRSFEGSPSPAMRGRAGRAHVREEYGVGRMSPPVAC